MRNKEFLKLLKKNKSKSNSGFTLTELLVGVIMSTFVIGALGFGLMQVLRVTQEGNSETAARNEASRALDFITDEMRRAESIQVDKSALVTGFTPLTRSNGAGGTVDIDPSLILNIPGLTNPIVYSVAPPQGSSPWKGPLVIYRWGPDLNADGSYSTGAWSSQALVDEVDDTDQTLTCGGSSITYQGFFACVVDNDGDSFTENATDTNGDGEITSDDDPTDTNGDGNITAADGFSDTNGDGAITAADDITDMNSDGEINEQDGADVDGRAITAQLYFTGGTIANSGSSGYSAETQVVARARTAPENKSDTATAYVMSYRSLGAVYGCEPTSGSEWTMRTDFINNSDDPDNQSGYKNRKWVHKPNRQSQPIKIDTSKDLDILSVPIDTSSCISRGGDKAVNGINYTNKDLGENTSVYEKDGSGNYVLESGKPKLKSDVHIVKHTVDFDDPATYNGYATDDIDVGDGTAVFLRKDSIVPGNTGYDPDGDDTNNSTTTNDQRSLGEFLADPDPNVTGEPTYAVNIGDQDGDGIDDYQITNIGYDERIVAFEVGQESTATDQPGFDLQDNIFILTSEVFSKLEPDP